MVEETPKRSYPTPLTSSRTSFEGTASHSCNTSVIGGHDAVLHSNSKSTAKWWALTDQAKVGLSMGERAVLNNVAFLVDKIDALDARLTQSLVADPTIRGRSTTMTSSKSVSTSSKPAYPDLMDEHWNIIKDQLNKYAANGGNLYIVRSKWSRAAAATFKKQLLEDVGPTEHTTDDSTDAEKHPLIIEIEDWAHEEVLDFFIECCKKHRGMDNAKEAKPTKAQPKKRTASKASGTTDTEDLEELGPKLEDGGRRKRRLRKVAILSPPIRENLDNDDDDDVDVKYEESEEEMESPSSSEMSDRDSRGAKGAKGKSG